MCLKRTLFMVIALVFSTDSMAASRSAVAPSAGDIHPLLIGAPIPAISLDSVAGEPVLLNQLVAEKPTVLIFYRGGWCPFCTRHLAGLKAVESQLTELGYQIIAISPDHPGKLAESHEAFKLSYTLLSDSKMQAAQAFGIAFQVDKPTLKRLTSYNIDIEAASGEKHHQLPVPSVFLVGPDGRIGFTYVNPDYKVRIDAKVLMAAAQAVLGQ